MSREFVHNSFFPCVIYYRLHQTFEPIKPNFCNIFLYNLGISDYMYNIISLGHLRVRCPNICVCTLFQLSFIVHHLFARIDNQVPVFNHGLMVHDPFTDCNDQHPEPQQDSDIHPILISHTFSPDYQNCPGNTENYRKQDDQYTNWPRLVKRTLHFDQVDRTFSKFEVKWETVNTICEIGFLKKFKKFEMFRIHCCKWVTLVCLSNRGQTWVN